MILFLTSNTGHTVFKNGTYCLGPIYAENQLRAKLKSLWPGKAKMLLVASEPDDYDMSKMLLDSTAESLESSGLPAELTMLDRRNQHLAAHLVARSDVIQLCGGHVPTQMEFFRELGLAELLRDHKGILIGVSAGSMNCGRVVYASPEREGEAIDPDYDRYPAGMGLVELVFLPHFNEMHRQWVDGKRMIQDIMLPDSHTVPFLAIPDGSYFLVENGRTTLCGEGYWVEKGEIVQICAEGRTCPLNRGRPAHIM